MTKIERKSAALVAALLFVCLAFTQAAFADEGMWTFDNFPSKTVAAKYGFSPSTHWLDHDRGPSFAAPRRMLGILHFSGGPGDDKSPLRS